MKPCYYGRNCRRDRCTFMHPGTQRTRREKTKYDDKRNYDEKTSSKRAEDKDRNQRYNRKDQNMMDMHQGKGKYRGRDEKDNTKRRREELPPNKMQKQTWNNAEDQSFLADIVAQATVEIMKRFNLRPQM